MVATTMNSPGKSVRYMVAQIQTTPMMADNAAVSHLILTAVFPFMISLPPSVMSADDTSCSERLLWKMNISTE